MHPIVGVLALQGGFASHIAVLESLDARAIEVRTDSDLARCDALVIPGGESTVITRLLMKGETGPAFGVPWEPSPLWLAIRVFGQTKPVMGTCAGLIMLSQGGDDDRVYPLGLLPVRVSRNAYGRQTESFIEPIALSPAMAGVDAGEPYRATFIRAPRILETGEGVETLAAARGHGGVEPVMVRRGNLLGLAFHPELTPEDPRIHRYFLGMLGESE